MLLLLSAQGNKPRAHTYLYMYMCSGVGYGIGTLVDGALVVVEASHTHRQGAKSLVHDLNGTPKLGIHLVVETMETGLS